MPQTTLSSGITVGGDLSSSEVQRLYRNLLDQTNTKIGTLEGVAGREEELAGYKRDRDQLLQRMQEAGGLPLTSSDVAQPPRASGGPSAPPLPPGVERVPTEAGPSTSAAQAPPLPPGVERVPAAAAPTPDLDAQISRLRKPQGPVFTRFRGLDIGAPPVPSSSEPGVIASGLAAEQQERSGKAPYAITPQGQLVVANQRKPLQAPVGASTEVHPINFGAEVAALQTGLIPTPGDRRYTSPEEDLAEAARYDQLNRQRHGELTTSTAEAAIAGQLRALAEVKQHPYSQFATSVLGIFPQGAAAPKAAAGTYDLVAGKDLSERLSGASKVIEAGGSLLDPTISEAAVLNPAHLAKGLAESTILAEGAGKAAEALGANQGGQELARTVGGWLPLGKTLYESSEHKAKAETRARMDAMRAAEQAREPLPPGVGRMTDTGEDIANQIADQVTGKPYEPPINPVFRPSAKSVPIGTPQAPAPAPISAAEAPQTPSQAPPTIPGGEIPGIAPTGGTRPPNPFLDTEGAKQTIERDPNMPIHPGDFQLQPGPEDLGNFYHYDRLREQYDRPGRTNLEVNLDVLNHMAQMRGVNPKVWQDFLATALHDKPLFEKVLQDHRNWATIGEMVEDSLADHQPINIPEAEELLTAAVQMFGPESPAVQEQQYYLKQLQAEEAGEPEPEPPPKPTEPPTPPPMPPGVEPEAPTAPGETKPVPPPVDQPPRPADEVQPQGQEMQTPEGTPTEPTRVERLVKHFAEAMDRAEMPTDPREIRKMAQAAVGGKPEEYIDDIYDAIEGALNLYGRKAHWTGNLREQIALAEKLEQALGRRLRTIEITKLQQFSTPLTISRAAGWAADMRPTDVMLEPTGGTGNLVEPFRGEVRRIVVNEIDPRRVNVLQALGYEPLQGDFMRMKIHGQAPTVVSTNPPWGKISTGRYRALDVPAPWGKYGDVSERFTVKALSDLADGGRMVAIMPTTITGPASNAYRKWLESNFTLRAMVEAPPGAYDQRGTSVGSILMVVDKGKFGGDPIVRLGSNQPQNWDEFASALQPLAEGGTHARPVSPEPTGPTEAPGAPVGPPGGAAGPEGRPAPTTLGGGGVSGPAGTTAGAETGQGLPPVRGPGEGTGQVQPTGAGLGPGVVSPGDVSTTVDSPGADGEFDPATAPRLVRQGTPALRPTGVAAKRIAEFDEASDSSIFTPYAVRSGARGHPHPRQVVETKSLAGMPAPELNYQPSATVMDAHKRGVLSDEQVDIVAAVGQAIERGHGLLVADDVGVGKSREIIGTVVDWMEKGKAKRILITSKSTVNLQDLEQEARILLGIPEGGQLPFRVLYLRDFKEAREGYKGDYKPLPAFDNAIYLTEAHNLTPYRRAITDLAPDGVLADEAHSYKNADAMMGQTWKFLHLDWMGRKIPISYFSATPAVTLDELEYLYGLREWKPDGFTDWVMRKLGLETERQRRQRGDTELPPDESGATGIDSTERGGASQMQDAMKKLYEAQKSGDKNAIKAAQDNLDKIRKKQKFGRGGSDVFSMAVPTSEMEQIMRELKGKGKYISRDLWRGGVEFAQEDRPMSAQEKQRYDTAVNFLRDVETAYWKYAKMDEAKGPDFGPGSQLQAAAKRLQFEMRLDRAIEMAKESLKRGEQPVISLININETKEGEGNVFAALNKINVKKRLFDADSGEIEDLGEIPEAVIAKNELLERAKKEFPPLPDPIERIYKALGRENVSVVTGDVPIDRRRAEMESFQKGVKKTAVISGAGKTGISLHHVLETPEGAHGRRHLILADYEWSATSFKQELGRVDRAGQISPPRISALTLGSAAEKKFIATIANRMKSLGAVSKGAAESTGTGALETFELGGDVDNLVLREAWRTLDPSLKQYFRGAQFQDVSRDGTQTPKNLTSADIKQFLLQLQLMPVDKGNAVWDHFWQTRQEIYGNRAVEELQQRRTQKSSGQILRTFELKPDLAMYEVRDQAGHRSAIISGMVTEYMPQLRPFIEHGEEGARRTRREYMTFTTEQGAPISGLKIIPSQIQALAEVFGQKALFRHTPERAYVDLQAGDKIDLDRGWQLRLGQAGSKEGKIVIEGAGLTNTERGKVFGNDLGVKYSAVSNFFFLPNDKAAIEKFLERFPIKQQVSKEVEQLQQQQANPEEGLGRRGQLGGPEAENPERGSFSLRSLRRSVMGAKASGNQDLISRRQILDETSKLLDDLPIRVGNMAQRRNVLGIYKIRPEVVRTREAEDLETAYHEVGHHLNKLLWGYSPSSPQGRTLAWKQFVPYRAELTAIASQPRAGQSPLPEGFAEFIRMYVNNPGAAKRSAPLFSLFFQRELARHPDVKAILENAQQNVERYKQQPAASRILAHMSKEQDVPDSNHFDNFYTAVVDRLTPLKRAVDAMNKPVDGSDAYEVARLLAGWTGKADTFLNRGTFDPRGIRQGQPLSFTGPSLKEILKPLDGRLDDLRAFMVAARAVEKGSQGMSTGVDTKDAQAVIQQYAKDPAIVKASQQLYGYQDQVLRYMVKSGFISPDQYNAMKELNRLYVPFYRVMEPGPGGTGGASGTKMADLWNPVKYYRGSTRQLVDPLESIIKNTYTMIHIAERNRVGQALVKAARETEGSGKFVEKVPGLIKPTTFEIGEIRKALEQAGFESVMTNQGPGLLGQNGQPVNLETLAQIFRPAGAPKGANIISVVENGKRNYYQVQPDLAKVMTGMDAEQIPTFIRLLSAPAKMLRAGATALSPGFVIRNPIRDAQDALMQSKNGFIPGWDSMKGLFHALKKDDLYWEWKAAGGEHSAMASLDRTHVQNELKDLISGHAKYVLRHPVEALRILSELSETQTRLGEYAKARQKGKTPEQAALESREVTVDFARRGAATKAVNSLVAFWNASVQGTDKFARMHMENPRKAILMGTAGLTLPSLMLYALNRDDEKYKELPQYQKDFFFNIPTRGTPLEDKTPFIRIPKPFLWGMVYSSIPEHIAQYIDKKDPHAFDDLASNLFNASMPGFVPTAAVPIIEGYANKSMFRGTPLEPGYEQKYSPEYRQLPQTSEIAKTTARGLARAGIHVSPIVLDNALYGYTGGMGHTVSQTIDRAAAYARGRAPVKPPAPQAADLPVLGAFAARWPDAQAKSIRTFYDRVTALEQKNANSKGVAAAPAMTDEETEELSQLETAKADLAELRKQMRDVQQSEMEPHEKRQQLNELQLQMIDRAREAMGNQTSVRTPPPPVMPRFMHLGR